MIIITIINYIALFSYFFIALYNDYANVKKLKAKNIPRYQDTLITNLKILIHVHMYKK